MRARKKLLIIATITVALILMTLVLVGCQPSGSTTDAKGIGALLKDYVTALNEKDIEGVARTLYLPETNEYNSFIENYPDQTYFNSLAYPEYYLVSLRNFEEVGFSANFSKWSVKLQVRYSVLSDNGSKVTATDNFDNSFHFAKREEKWYFTTLPSPYEGNLPGEGFVLDEEQLPDYTVTFDSNGGSEISPVELKKGDAFELPEPPTREGYAFGGWYTGNDFITEWRDTMKIDSDTTLFAKWLKAEGSDDASLILGEAEGKVYSYVAENLYSIKVTVSNSLEKFEATERFSCREGATLGAFYDIKGTERLSEEHPLDVGDNRFYIIVTSENGELTSVYSVNVLRLNAHTLSFADGETGATLLTSIKVDHGRYADLSSVETPRKDNYTFDGWLLNRAPFDAETTQILNDVVLTADWKPLATVVNLNHLYSNLPAGASESVEVFYGQSFRFPVPIRNGYRFEGWLVNNTLVTDSLGYSTSNWSYPNSAVPYSATASWVPIIYNIYYRGLVDGTNDPANPNTFTVSSNITFRTPTRAGYRFEGWSRNATENQPITGLSPGSYGDLTVYAFWDAIDYTVRFFDEDGTTSLSASQEVSSTEKIVKPADPLKDGKTFVGWFTDLTYKVMWDFRNYPRKGQDTRYFDLYALFTDEYTAGLQFSVNGLGSAYSIAEYTGSEVAPIIPNEYLGKPVVSIEGYAFSGTKVKVIRLPENVAHIEIGAFSNCSDLEIFETHASDIAKGALSGTSSLAEITVGNYAGELGELFGTATYANSYEAGFTDETGKVLTSLWQVPNSLMTIRYTDVDVWRFTPYAFANFTSLENAEITVKTSEDFRIGHHSFYGCANLSEVIISGNTDKVTSIGYYTFAGCENLSTFGTADDEKDVITFPENLEQIGNYAFADVPTDIIVNASLAQIDEYALSKYSGERITVNHALKIVDYAFIDATNLKYFGDGNAEFLDLSKVTYLGLEAFSGCSSLTRVKLPDAEVNRIRKKAFSGCTSLVEVEFTNQNEIASDAFSRCTALETINLPATMSLIEASAFYGCENLETVKLPGIVLIQVHYHAFANTKVTQIINAHPDSSFNAQWLG